MNQQEIAKKLKVSQTTVSLVLNNPSTTKVSGEKRQKIMNLMRDSNYLLKAHNGKTWNIGYVLANGIDLNNSFYSRFFAGIQKSSAEAGYNVIIDNKDIRTSKLLTHRKVDGIILEDKLNTTTLKDLSKKIPLVLLNDSPQETVCDTVVPDNQGGIIKALDYLTGLGHSRIAFFGALSADGKMEGLLRERIYIFVNEIKRRELPITQDLIKTPVIKTISVEETEKILSETLSFWISLPGAPTAVICSNDFYGALLLRTATERNIKVPDSLSVIGTDNTNECEYTYPALTSIDHNAIEMGNLAVELLLKKINNPDRAFVKISCDSKLVIRKSSGPVKSK